MTKLKGWELNDAIQKERERMKKFEEQSICEEFGITMDVYRTIEAATLEYYGKAIDGYNKGCEEERGCHIGRLWAGTQ